ncbi:hypothetical protein DQG13_03125 [Paenibacillus sp. YN15]|nr:hypothetical protein DQG13_03125 [Paenibacillus sp. YN15]
MRRSISSAARSPVSRWNRIGRDRSGKWGTAAFSMETREKSSGMESPRDAAAIYTQVAESGMALRTAVKEPEPSSSPNSLSHRA